MVRGVSEKMKTYICKDCIYIFDLRHPLHNPHCPECGYNHAVRLYKPRKKESYAKTWARGNHVVQPWTVAEKTRARLLLKQGKSIAQICIDLNRSDHSVRKQLKRMEEQHERV